MGGGTVASQLINIASLVLLARLYSPAQIGLWSGFLYLTLLFQPIVTARYESAIVTATSDKEAQNIIYLCTTIAIAASSLIALAALFIPSSHFPVEMPKRVDILLAGLATILGLGGTSIALAWLNRKQLYTAIATASIIRTLVTGFISVTAAYLDEPRLEYLLISTIFGNSVQLFYLTKSAQLTCRSIGSALTLISIKASDLAFVAKKHSNFPKYNLPYALIGGVTSRALFLAFGWSYSATQLGLLSLAHRFTFLPISLVGAALRQIIFRKSAIEFGSPELNRTIYKLAITIVFAITGPSIAVLYNCDLIISYTLGTQWAESAIYVQWLLLPTSTLAITSWLDRLFDVAGRQKLALQLEIIYNFALFIVIGTASAYWNSTVWIALYSIVTAAYNWIWLYITFRIAKIPIGYFIKIALIQASLAATGFALYATLRYYFGYLETAIGFIFVYLTLTAASLYLIYTQPINERSE